MLFRSVSQSRYPVKIKGEEVKVDDDSLPNALKNVIEKAKAEAEVKAAADTAADAAAKAAADVAADAASEAKAAAASEAKAKAAAAVEALSQATQSLNEAKTVAIQEVKQLVINADDAKTSQLIKNLFVQVFKALSREKPEDGALRDEDPVNKALIECFNEGLHKGMNESKAKAAAAAATKATVEAIASAGAAAEAVIEAELSESRITIKDLQKANRNLQRENDDLWQNYSNISNLLQIVEEDNNKLTQKLKQEKSRNSEENNNHGLETTWETIW